MGNSFADKKRSDLTPISDPHLKAIKALMEQQLMDAFEKGFNITV
jgi:hypothetical protein